MDNKGALYIADAIRFLGICLVRAAAVFKGTYIGTRKEDEWTR